MKKLTAILTGAFLTCLTWVVLTGLIATLGSGCFMSTSPKVEKVNNLSTNSVFSFIDNLSTNVNVGGKFVIVHRSFNMNITNDFVWVLDNNIRPITIGIHAALFLDDPRIPNDVKEQYANFLKNLKDQ